jgi:hypothetical protein
MSCWSRCPSSHHTKRRQAYSSGGTRGTSGARGSAGRLRRGRPDGGAAPAVAIDSVTNFYRPYADFGLSARTRGLQLLARIEVGGTPKTNATGYVLRSPTHCLRQIAASGVASSCGGAWLTRRSGPGSPVRALLRGAAQAEAEAARAGSRWCSLRHADRCACGHRIDRTVATDPQEQAGARLTTKCSDETSKPSRSGPASRPITAQIPEGARFLNPGGDRVSEPNGLHAAVLTAPGRSD